MLNCCSTIELNSAGMFFDKDGVFSSNKKILVRLNGCTLLSDQISSNASLEKALLENFDLSIKDCELNTNSQFKIGSDVYSGRVVSVTKFSKNNFSNKDVTAYSDGEYKLTDDFVRSPH